MHNRHVRMAVLAALSSAGALTGLNAAAGDIAFDGSTGRFGTLDSVNNVYNILQSDGALRGTNLFHSFDIFNLDQGETAVFSGNAAITNIISRVTGGIPTNIDGTIRSTINGANFWFVNPAGITVGPSGAIDVSGAIALGAADHIEFLNGERFIAGLNEDGEIDLNFSMSAPVDFGFLQDSFGGGALVIESSELLSRTARISANQIQPLEGGSYSMLLSGAGGVFLTNDTGDIELHDARIRTGIDAETGMVGNISMQASGSINMSNSDLLTSADFDALGGGDIFIRGGELVTISRSNVVAESVDAFNSTGSIDISGSGVLINDYSQVALDFRSSFGGIEGIGVGTIKIRGTGVSDELAPETNLSTATAGAVRIVDSTISANNAGSRTGQDPFADVSPNTIRIGGKSFDLDDPDFDPDDPDFDPDALFGTTHVVIAGSTISADATHDGVASNISIAADQGIWIGDSTNGSSVATARASDTALGAGTITVSGGDAGVSIQNATFDIFNAAPGSADSFTFPGISVDASGDVRVGNSQFVADADNGFVAGSLGFFGANVYAHDSIFTASTTVRDPSQGTNTNFGGGGISFGAGSFDDEDDAPFPFPGGGPLATGNLLIQNSTLRANSNNDGSPDFDPIGANAGSISAFASGSLLIANSTLESAATGANVGVAGSIGLSARDIEVTGSTLNVSTESLNPAVRTADSLNDLDPGTIQLDTLSADIVGGSIKLTNSTLTASTSGVADSGGVFAIGTRIDIQGSNIQASTTGTGAAGGIALISFAFAGFPDPDDPGFDPGEPGFPDAPDVPGGDPFPTPDPGFIRITDSTLATSTGATPSTPGSILVLGLDGQVDIVRSSLNVSATASPFLQDGPDGPRIPIDVDFDPFNIGNIEISAGLAPLNIIDSTLQANTSGLVNGGSINVDSGSLLVRNSSITAASSAANLSVPNPMPGPFTPDPDASAGAIEILSDDATFESSVLATSAAATNGGDIELVSSNFVLRDSQILASAGGTGIGGDIFITASSVNLQNSQVQSSAETGVGGNIDIETGTATLQDSSIATNATSGNGGSISLDTAGAVLSLQNSSIVASAGGGGTGGDIMLSSLGAGTSLQGSQIQALANTGNGGTISLALVDAAGSTLQIADSQIATNATAANGGDITIDAAGAQLAMARSSVVASAGGTGTGGDIAILNVSGATLADSQVQALASAGSGGTINVNFAAGANGALQVDRSSITTNADTANGGNITLNTAGQQVRLTDSSVVASAGGSGTGGSISVLNAGALSLQNSQVQALADAGSGGTINIDLAAAPSGPVQLTNSAIRTNALNSNGGNITIDATGQRVSLQNSDIVASAGGTGTGGGISIGNAAGTTLQNSRIQALAAAGTGGTINIGLAAGQGGALTLDNSAIRTNATAANGGNIGVDAAGNQVVLRNSTIVASAGGSGTGGGISIVNAGGATLRNTQVQALASSGAGGTITIDLAENSGALLLDNSSITTNATNANGGNITLDAAGNQVSLRGTSIVASAGGNGAGGDIAIMNAGGATLQDTQIQALANAGAGGTISIDVVDGAGQLVIQRSNITTNAVAAGGGNITLDAGGNQLLLRDSRILASAGAAGTGGNILIDNLGRTIMQRSQILARADAGNGGTITINLTTGALFIRDAQSTISADSNSGNDGLVAINSPDTDLNPAVKPQDASLGETPELSANACTPAKDAARSTFVRDSRGGVSASPDGYLVSIQTDGATQNTAAAPAAKPADAQWALRVAAVQGVARGCN